MNDPCSVESSSTLQEALKLFEAWRTHRKKTGRIPEELWAAAVQACREHSIHKVSRTLRLSYSDLKARFEPVPYPPSTTRFVELNAPALPMAQPEVIVECDVEGHPRMRLHCRGPMDLGVADLVKSFFEAHR